MTGPLIATGNDIYPTEPLGAVDAIEVQPCACDEEGNTGPCTPEQAEFWSVYLHYAPTPGVHGVDCVADFMTERDALLFALFLAKLLRVPVTGPLPAGADA